MKPAGRKQRFSANNVNPQHETQPAPSMTEIIMSQTPPILHGPSEKERKYDRQLRLWAANGQAALESANILLLNSGPGAVGAETLKNLVLPGAV